jgi:hypothetical protein
LLGHIEFYKSNILAFVVVKIQHGKKLSCSPVRAVECKKQ